MVYHAPQLDDDTPFHLLSATQCTEMTGQVKKLSEKIKKNKQPLFADSSLTQQLWVVEINWDFLSEKDDLPGSH